MKNPERYISKPDSPPKEWEIERMRPSGPGGQHMQKTESKVRVRWNFGAANLSEEDKKKLLQVYPEGYIESTSQETRFQSKNIELAREKIQERVKEILAPQKERLATPTPEGAIEQRIREKKIRSEKKRFRGRVEPGEE